MHNCENMLSCLNVVEELNYILYNDGEVGKLDNSTEIIVLEKK